eukprot:3578262-Rhodomonas_salina.2
MHANTRRKRRHATTTLLVPKGTGTVWGRLGTVWGVHLKTFSSHTVSALPTSFCSVPHSPAHRCPRSVPDTA